ncbi:MAG: hypothetical protein ACXAAH_12680 [Promethearchaeota archaeon]|jgi:hypothetical protein
MDTTRCYFEMPESYCRIHKSGIKAENVETTNIIEPKNDKSNDKGEKNR